MLTNKGIVLTLAALAAAVTLVVAQDTVPKTTAPVDAKPVPAAKTSLAGTNAAAKTALKQADVASKTAKFGKITKTDETYKTALDAHALAAALQQANKDGAFKGRVAGIFEPRGGAMVIVNFDTNYRTALSGLLRKTNFTNFPALTNLTGKEVLISGMFINYQGRAEIILTNATQVKLVE